MTTPLYLTIDHDHDAHCPSEEDGWKLYSFNRRHTDYKDPEELGLSLDRNADGLPRKIPIGLRRKLKVGLAFWLSYFEHGLCTWFLRDDAERRRGMPDFQWDGCSLAGLLVWEQPVGDLGPKALADRREDAKHFLETYTAWANGESVVWRLGEADSDDTEGWCTSASLEFAERAVVDELKGEPPDRPVVVVGDEAGLFLRFHKIPGRVMVGDARDLKKVKEAPCPKA